MVSLATFRNSVDLVDGSHIQLCSAAPEGVDEKCFVLPILSDSGLNFTRVHNFAPIHTFFFDSSAQSQGWENPGYYLRLDLC